nr:AAA domain-containing protein [Candidatus Sigynarchaeota archaeon]
MKGTSRYNNLFYHAIYGTDDAVGRMVEATRESLRPYQAFLQRSIDAENERKIHAHFTIIKDEKTLLLDRQTLKFEYLPQGIVEIRINPGWHEIVNAQEVIANYDPKPGNPISIYYSFSDGMARHEINENEFQRVLESEDEDRYERLFINLSSLNVDVASTDFFLKQAPIKLKKVVENPEHSIIEQDGAIIEVAQVYEKERGVFTFTYEGSIRHDIPISINGFLTRDFSCLKADSIAELDKVQDVDENGKIMAEVPFTRYFEKNFVIIEKKPNVHRLRFISTSGNELTFREIHEQSIEYIEDDVGKRIEVKRIDNREYFCTEFPEEGIRVKGSDGNLYRTKIKIKQGNGIKLQLLESDDESEFEELSRRSDIDYFFEDDVEKIMGADEYKKSENSGMLFPVKNKNSENRTLVVDTRSEKMYDHCLRKLEQLEKDGKPIFLHRNTYQLEIQKEFIDILMNRPLKDWEPILRICEDRDQSAGKWCPVQQIRDQDINWQTDELKIRAGEAEGTDQQRRFVCAALGTPEFAFLEGPPGSGKTTTILELIFQLISKGKRVLLSASTHVAIDNVLDLIATRYPEWLHKILPLRIGDEDNIAFDSAKQFQINNILNGYADDDKDGLKELILDAANLVCGTMIGIVRHPWFQKERKGRQRKVFPKFDYLIIDESSKTTFQEFLIPALFARKWILVGDIQQLAPYAEPDYLKKYFEKLQDNDQDVFPDADQYANFYIHLIYGSYLLHGPEKNKNWCLPADINCLYAMSRELLKRISEYKRTEAHKLDIFPRTVFVTNSKNLPVDNHHTFSLSIDDVMKGNPNSALMEFADVICLDINYIESLIRIVPASFMVINLKNMREKQ